jgi:hypothetical protein
VARPTLVAQPSRLMRLRGKLVVAISLAGTVAGEAGAEPNDVNVRHTRTSEPSVRIKQETDLELDALAQKVDSILYEGVQDLGLNVDISRQRAHNIGSDEPSPELPSGEWTVSSELQRRRGNIVLKLSVTPPGSEISYQSLTIVDPETLEMRLVVMLRDLVRAARGKPRAAETPDFPDNPKHLATPAVVARSPGRPILALNAALLGGFVGYSLQHASGSTDERLTYPLAALGAGVGLGGSMLVSEEWDVGVGDAWFLSAGMWWPLLSGTLIAGSYDIPRSNRYAYGLLGTTAGITLATTALGFGHVSDGGAVLAHSGGVFGTLLGGLVDAAIAGSTSETPRRGMGYGAAAGVLLTGALATQLEISPSRVLMIDLGASLGALTGAAAASPLLLVDESNSNAAARNRLWLASIGAGTLIGGAVGWWTTRSTDVGRVALFPTIGPIAVKSEVPAFGAMLTGSW